MKHYTDARSIWERLDAIEAWLDAFEAETMEAGDEWDDR